MNAPGRLPDLLAALYRRLYEAYGPQRWWPGDSPFEVIVGAILTQSTAWVNVEKALGDMRTAGCWSFEAISELPQPELAAIIRSSGYYNAKARKLQAFANHVLERHGGSLDVMFAQDIAALRRPSFCSSTASATRRPTTYWFMPQKSRPS